VKNYEFVFTQFQDEFGDRLIKSITSEEILFFLTKLADGTKQSTQRNRYSSLKAFFNYINNSIDPNFRNPCGTPILRKLFKDRKTPPWPFFKKELIDEIIFKTTNPRNRIMLELMARGGMRVGEVLKIRAIQCQGP
jgi:site-specific recombinase XerD